MEQSHGDSHATQAEKEAADAYRANMQAESERFNAQMAEAYKTHDAEVNKISKLYTDALGITTGGDIPY